MKAWRHKEYHHVYYRETSYKKLHDGMFEAVYESFYPDFGKLIYRGASKDAIREQIESTFEYIELPTPKSRLFTVEPIAIHLNCPLCKNRMTFIPNHFARHEHYMHKCVYCNYEYEMPYVHDGQIVWTSDPEDVRKAIDSCDLDKLKEVVNTKPELT